VEHDTRSTSEAQPTLKTLPDPPPGRTGWPWTEQSDSLPEKQSDGSPWPKISIVTPSYNQGRYIEQTIRSVILQGYPNLEYVVIDGGSSDETVDVLKKYDTWIDHWISEPDRGQTHAINKGLSYCTGDLFNWINSDDYLAQGALPIVGRAFSGSSPPDLVCGYNRRFDDETGETVECVRLELAQVPDRSVAEHTFIQPSTYYRMGVVQSLGKFDEGLNFNMDKEYFIRYILKYGQEKVHFKDGLISHFRLHDSSKTVAEDEDFEEEKVTVYESLLESLKNNGEGERRRWKPEAVDRRKTINSICLYLALMNERQGGKRFRTYWLVFQSILAEPSMGIERYNHILSILRRPLSNIIKKAKNI